MVTLQKSTSSRTRWWKTPIFSDRVGPALPGSRASMFMTFVAKHGYRVIGIHGRSWSGPTILRWQ